MGYNTSIIYEKPLGKCRLFVKIKRLTEYDKYQDGIIKNFLL